MPVRLGRSYIQIGENNVTINLTVRCGVTVMRNAKDIGGDPFLIFDVMAASAAFALDPTKINGANFEEKSVAIVRDTKGANALVLKLQILLDRAHFSPGVIDGRMGDNTVHALREFEKQTGLPPDGRLDQKAWTALNQGAPKGVISYQVTAEDAAGPFAETIPEDFAGMARMKSLPYTSPAELLSEKFHVDIKLLKELNRGVHFDRPGKEITVPNVANTVSVDEVKRIEVDKTEGVLRGYGAEGRLIVVYPASIGSNDNPSPSGDMTVKGVARNPKYSYRPDKNFQQQGNDEPLTLPSGPNGPVGSIWIDLTKETYGIHGTASPELVGKTQSHGCVRLTNWNAEELGRLVKPGTKVSFVN